MCNIFTTDNNDNNNNDNTIARLYYTPRICSLMVLNCDRSLTENNLFCLTQTSYPLGF